MLKRDERHADAGVDEPRDEQPLAEDEPDLDLGWDEDENEERRRDPLRHKLPG